MKKHLICFKVFMLILFPSIFLMATEEDHCKPFLELEVNPDIVAVLPTESITFNVLENDIGEGIFIKGISKQPLCGSVEVLDAAMGEVRYTPDKGCLLNVINFEYEIEGIEGNLASAEAKVVMNREESELVVGLEIDCTDVEVTGVRTLNIMILEGTAPFTISGSLNEVLEEKGKTSIIMTDGEVFIIHVIDAVGNEFFQEGGTAACVLLHPEARLHHISEIGDCTCDGSLVSNFDNIQIHNETITKILGSWVDDNGNEVEIDLGDTIPPNKFFYMSHIQTDKWSGWGGYDIATEDILKRPEGFTSDFCPPESYTLQTTDDFANTLPNEPVTINLLQNDTGTNLQINAINLAPTCGEITDLNPETGEIVYIPNADTECTVDVFIYEVVDECGNLEEATAMIFIEQFSDFFVQVERDCCLADYTGIYTLSVFVSGGEPPYTIFGSINDTLEEAGTISIEIHDGQPYDITVIDSENSEYFESGGETSCLTLAPPVSIQSIEEITDCTCEGEMVFSFEAMVFLDEESTYSLGIWKDENQEWHEIYLGDTIPSDASFEIHAHLRLILEDECQFLGEVNVSDFCSDQSACIKALPDFATATLAEPITFNVLSNDIGEGISIKKISKPPFCGTVEVLDSLEGILQYTPTEPCLSNLVRFDYQIEDEFGGVAEGEVKIVINKNEQKDDLLVTVGTDCCEIPWSYQNTFTLDILIAAGTPPFTLSGTVNTVLNETGMLSVPLYSFSSYEVNVMDALGNEFSEIGNNESCHYDCEALKIETETLLEAEVVECLCDGSIIVHLDIFGNNEEIESIYGFWYSDNDDNLQTHAIEVGDTIPPNAYLEIFEVQTDRRNYALYTDESDFLGIHSSDFCSLETFYLEAAEDFEVASIGDSITLQVFQNDIGIDLQIYQILIPPTCGEILEFDAETGEIVYLVNETTDCTLDYIAYEVVGKCGNYDFAWVTIGINRGETDLIVEVGRNCELAEQYGTYILNLLVVSGVPPFTIFGSINTTLEEFGAAFTTIDDGNPYEISVVDAEGKEFYTSGGVAACNSICPQTYELIIEDISDIAHCTCDGNMIFHFEGLGLELNTEFTVYGNYWDNGIEDFIEVGTVVPQEASFEISFLSTEHGCYNLSISDISDISGNVSNFCPPQTPPIALNQSESQILVCGEGDIILSIEGGGENATYNWYLDAALTIPANPPTGQVWVNDEIFGARIIYVQATDENGCKSEPLAISTYHYTLIEVDDLEIEIDETKCERYRVSFHIRGGNGVYTINGNSIWNEYGRYISEWIPIEDDYFFVIDDSPLIPNCEPVTISGLASDLECLPVANDDYRTNVKGENTTVQVLHNDTGKDIQLTSILIPPQCGQIVDFNTETRTISYQGDIDSECKGDSFEYQITDANGQTATGTVHIVFVETSSELVVEVVSDCSNQYLDGTVDLNVRILGGVPPFEVNGVIGNSSEPFHHTLEDYGEIVKTFSYEQEYEVTVIDAVANTFTRTDYSPCCYTVEVVPYLDCFIEGEDTLAILTYELIDEYGEVWMQDLQGNPQNDTLKNGEFYFILGPGSHDCGYQIIENTVDCEFTSIQTPNSSIPNIHLFPNPNNGNFTLSLESKQAEIIDIEILDITGQVKLWQRLKTLPTVERQTFERHEDLPSGLYFIRVSGKDWTWTEKMMVE